MLQRPINSSFRALVQDQDCIIDIEQNIQETKYAPRMMDKRSGYFLRPSILNLTRDKWVHAIPVVVLLCLFTLWWFSYPVNLEIKDGRLVDIYPADQLMPLPLNTRHVALAASATSPIAPAVPDQDLTLRNEIEALVMSNESFLLYENDEDFTKTMHGADNEMPLILNTNHVALTTTSVASPIITPDPQDPALINNETEAHQSFQLYGNDEAFDKAHHADHDQMPLPLNADHVAISTLASLTSPVAPVPHDLTLKDQTEAQYSISNESFTAL